MTPASKIPAAALDSLPLALSANQALCQFRQLTGIEKSTLTGAGLLYERAFMLGLTPGNTVSPNGSCHLLPCQDGLLAVNLPRPSDWELLPAWLGPWLDAPDIAQDDWNALEQACRELAAGNLLQQAHALGLAVAVADQLPPPPSHPFQSQCFRPPNTTAPQHRHNLPLVVDLSSLWAGPLCSHLLQQTGCRVIKVEGVNRPDGARTGSPDFFHLLNQGKESVVLDFQSAADIETLKQLIAQADIVIEGSRPHALRNAGIDAEHYARSQPGLVWLSITGYGRYGTQGNLVGFGDDTAAAAGLSRIMFEATGEYQIVGDAIADPLTGIHAALFAWQSYRAGGNELISISLRDTVAFCLHQELNQNRESVLESCRQWKKRGSNLNQLFPDGPRIPTQDTVR